MSEYHETVAILLMRLFLGCLFFFQGYDKVFNVKISGVVGIFEIPAASHHVSKRWLNAVAVYTSFAELLGGALLILGLFKYIALYALGIDLLLVAAAFGVIQPVWDLRHVFPRLVLLAALLLLPADWDVISADYWLGLL